MPVIKQTAAVKGIPSTYRLVRVDGQTPKPYPIWKYTWILPNGVDAEFKSVDTGYPMVIVQWNEVSQPGSPFSLKCEVETDATDGYGINCVSTTIIDVNVGEEIINLSSEIWGPTGACIKVGDGNVGTDITYYGKTLDAKDAIWNATNGKFRINGSLVYGPIVSSNVPLNGITTVNVNWQDGSTHEVTLYGMDASGNSSPKSIFPTYPDPSVSATIGGLNNQLIGSGDAIFPMSVLNTKLFNPNYYIVYNAYAGQYNTTGPVGDDNSYTWTHTVITDPDLHVHDVPNNIYTKNFLLPDDLNTTGFGDWIIKFKPQFISDIDPTCFSETTIVKNFSWVRNSYIPIFTTGPALDRNATYTPIYHINPSTSKVVTYTPTFTTVPYTWAYTGTYYTPIFTTGPSKTKGVIYAPTFTVMPIVGRNTEYLPVFTTGPSKVKSVEYIPIFVSTPNGVGRWSYTPTFITDPTSSRNVEYSPRFPTAPSKARDVEYVPIFINTPVAVDRWAYTPTFNVDPTSNRDAEYTPIFTTGPTKTRDAEYVPMFVNTPTTSARVPYTPTFVDSPIKSRNANYVPRFSTGPAKTRSASYVPVFKITPSKISAPIVS